MSVLTVSNLRATRGGFRLGPISFQVEEGELFTIVGPNGSGKTTFISMLTGELSPSAGSVEIMGDAVDPIERNHLKHIGLVPDDADLILGELSARETWRLAAELHARAGGQAAEITMQRAEDFAERMDFVPPARPSSGYSHGMKKKTQTICALAVRPRLLVVDELRNGLDPIASRLVQNIVDEERRAGTAVIAASHDLAWAERYSDRVAVFSHGSVVAMGTVDDILGANETALEDAFFRLVGARSQ